MEPLNSLNFERALIKLQRAIKSKERKKSFGVGGGGGNQNNLIFLGRSLSRLENIQTLDSPESFYVMGSSQSKFGLDNLATLPW